MSLFDSHCEESALSSSSNSRGCSTNTSVTVSDSMLLVTFIARQTNVVVCSVWSTLNDDSFMQ